MHLYYEHIGANKLIIHTYTYKIKKLEMTEMTYAVVDGEGGAH